MIFAFGVLLGTDFLKQFLENTSQKANQIVNGEEEETTIDIGGQLITIMATVITLAVNYLIQIFVYGFTEWERHQSRTLEKYSLVFKLVISQFINTAFIYYFISLINNRTNDDLLSASGLVYQVSSLITVSGIIQIFNNVLNVGDIIRRLTIWWYYRNSGETVNEYQLHLNKAYEYVEFDIAARYSYYILQLWTVSFYAYVVPIGIPSMAIIFFFQYWADKYNLWRRSSMYYEIHYSLSSSIIRLASMSIFIYAAGSALFSFKIHHSVPPILIVGLVLALIFTLVSLFISDRL